MTRVRLLVEFLGYPKWATPDLPDGQADALLQAGRAELFVASKPPAALAVVDGTPLGDDVPSDDAELASVEAGDDAEPIPEPPADESLANPVPSGPPAFEVRRQDHHRQRGRHGRG